MGDVPLLASLLESNIRILFFTRKYAFSDPNYGSLWFRCKEYFISSPKEVGLGAWREA